MAFNLQDDNGNVPEANAYIAVEFLKEYAASKGADLAAYQDAQLETAIVRATTYIDARFEYIGWRRNGDQATAWPRSEAYDLDDWEINGLPLALKKAVAEYALLAAANTDLMPNPVTENGAVIQSKSETVGPIATTVTYFGGGLPQQPRYPLADNILRRAGLVTSGKSLVRG